MNKDSTYVLFPGLEEKEKYLIDVIKNYDIDSIIKAAFTINSWRNNRGAQESCLSLNAAILHCDGYGKKKIDTHLDFVAFFNKIYEALKIEYYDDPVLKDFGEIKLFFNNKFYPIITGTGHSFPVFSALQCLEPVTRLNNTFKDTLSVLSYVEKMIDMLFNNNGSTKDAEDLSPVFECPSEDYYKDVCNFIDKKFFLSLPKRIITLFSNENSIETAHFYNYNNTILPLFNPSILIDYYTVEINKLSAENKASIVINQFKSKIKRYHLNKDIPNCILFENFKLAFDKKAVNTAEACTLVYYDRDDLMLFIDVSQIDNSKYDLINDIMSAHSESKLSIINFEETSGNYCRAYGFDASVRLTIIPYCNYIGEKDNFPVLPTNIDAKVMELTFTAIDLIFVLMFSPKIEDIADYIRLRNDYEHNIISFGGKSDDYSIFLSTGDVSKGAIEYYSLAIECDSAAQYIYEQYLVYNEFFPFNYRNVFLEPECWAFEKEEEAVSFASKTDFSHMGTLIKTGKNVLIVNQYNMKKIMLEMTNQQFKIQFDLYRSIVEYYFMEYNSLFSSTGFMKNKILLLNCSSLIDKVENNKYINIIAFYEQNGVFIMDYDLNCAKLMIDLKKCKDRSIELSIILELLFPLAAYYPTEYNLIQKKIVQDKSNNKNFNADAVQLKHYYNPNSFGVSYSEKSNQAVRKVIAMICHKASIVPGEYQNKEATSVIRSIQKEIVGYLEKLLITYNKHKTHIILLSFLSHSQFRLYTNDYCYHLNDNINQDVKEKNHNKIQKEYEKIREEIYHLRYLIETNLSIESRTENVISDRELSMAYSLSEWLVAFQNNSDLCFHTDSQATVTVLDDFRIDVHLSDHYQNTYKDVRKRYMENSVLSFGDENDNRSYMSGVISGFYDDTGVKFEVLEVVMRYLYEAAFPEGNQNFEELKANVFSIEKSEAILDCKAYIVDSIMIEDIKKAFDFLILDCSKIKMLKGKINDILPIWDRENRDNRFEVKPIIQLENKLIYSPICIYELHRRWISGIHQFYIPYEYGLTNTCKALAEWKGYYEKIFSNQIKNYFIEKKFDFADADIDIRRKDREGNHPGIHELGDYDVIGLDSKNKRIFIIECKFLQPVGSVFEHSKEQERFFQKEKFDEKFQKRIDYLSSVYRSFFNNLGYNINEKEEYDILPYMVVNKVFASYYKEIKFPIITFDELKRIVEGE